MQNEPISVENLTKRYGGTTVVDDLSFSVGWGKVTGFLGPNGAGKTTTMRAILGLVEPTSGRALVLGRPYADLRRPARRVGALLEANGFHPQRTARQHLRIVAAAAGIPPGQADEVLRLVRLSEAAGKRVKAFSLGMRQRLGLASALLGAPRILVLDEPANGLDPAGIRWLRRALGRYAANGNAVFVSSHLLSEMEQLADEIVLIDRGRLVRHGPVVPGALERMYFDLLGRKEAS